MDDGGTSLRKLSDKELIKQFCPDRRDEKVAKELWRRHRETIYASLKRVAADPSFRPDGCDYKTFVDSSYSWAYRNFLNRICGYKFKGPIEHWLGKLALTTALDERRAILRGIEDVIGIEEAFPYQDPEDVGFRTKLYRLRSRYSKNPVSTILAEERRFIVRELLVRHAASSDKDADSARTIRLYHWRDWPVPRIAKYKFGEAANKLEKGAREKRIYRLLYSNYTKLKALLNKEFNIKALREVV